MHHCCLNISALYVNDLRLQVLLCRLFIWENSTDVNVGFHLFSTDVRLFITSLEGPSGDFFYFFSIWPQKPPESPPTSITDRFSRREFELSSSDVHKNNSNSDFFHLSVNMRHVAQWTRTTPQYFKNFNYM